MKRFVALVPSFALVCALAAHAGTSAGGGAAGTPPAALSSHLAVGLFEQNGGSWMHSSGVPWDVRYEYLTKGWANNWGWGATDGSWALTFMRGVRRGALHPCPDLV